MKHLAFLFMFSIYLSVKKGGSFSRLMDINTNSLHKFDEPVYGDVSNVQRISERQDQIQQPAQQVSNQNVQRQPSRHYTNQQEVYRVIDMNQAQKPQEQKSIIQPRQDNANDGFYNKVYPPLMLSEKSIEIRLKFKGCVEDQELFDKLSSVITFKYESGCKMKRLVYEGKYRVFKMCKISIEDEGSNNIDIGNEMHNLVAVGDLGQGNFVQFQGCKYGYINTEYFVALIFQDYDQSLIYLNNNSSSNGYMLKQNIPEIQLIKMYRDLFFSLEELNNAQLVHRNITPTNLLSSLNLQNYDDRKKAQYKLIISNMNIMQKAEQHGKINGVIEYIHPHLFASDQRVIGDYLDIFSLALSIIEISTYKKDQFDHKDFMGDYLKTIDTIKRKPKQEQAAYMLDQFEKFKSRIQKLIGVTDEQAQGIKQVLAECLEQSNPEQHFNGGMRSVCQNNVYCILFSALNFNINFIPDATFFKETLNSLISNLSNRFII